jgi:hypothetical protein
MKFGSYGNGNTDFSKFKLSCVPLYLRSTADIKYSYGCGANALSILTGIPPSNFYRKGGHFSDRYMISALRATRFHVYEVNKSNLTSKKSFSIDDRTLLLFSQLIKKGEASWKVSYGGQSYHNFDISVLNSWELLNMPISSMYVLYPKKNHE